MMKLVESNLPAFRAWLIRRGRGDETARTYLSHLRCTISAPSLTSRILDRTRPAKTRWSNMAALTQWAKFAGDAAMMTDLSEIKLPPPRRSKPKKELDLTHWSALLAVLRDDSVEHQERVWRGKRGQSWTSVIHVRDRKRIARPLRLLLLIVATRGLRMGDTLRITRSDIAEAIATGKLSFEVKGGGRLEYDAKTIIEYLKALNQIEGWTVTRDLVLPPESSDRAVNTKLARALRVAAIRAVVADVHPHRLRRTYATHFVRRLNNDAQALVKLMRHMGWTNINTAAQYVDNVNLDELDKLGGDLISDVMGMGQAKGKVRKK